jgi:hypothetical protein
MVNGFPTQKIVPFSDITLNPASISTSAATTFTFASPVYLQDGIEYAIVIMSNSNKYNVRYAQIGDEDQNGNRISQQPYAGVLFKSQNASTWTADQNKDLMFTLNRAVFSTVAKTCVLRNATQPSRALIENPLTTVASGASATNIFACAHRDHGMKAADTVTFAGFAATNGYDFSTATTAGGSFVVGTEYKIVSAGNTDFTAIGAANNTTNTVFTATGVGSGTGTAYGHELNKIHTITAVTRDSYTITVAGSGHIAAITAGNGGGTTAQATQHLAWNTIHPIIQQVVLPDTTQTWTVKDTSETQNAAIASTATAISVNEDYTPLVPKAVKLAANVNGTSHSLELTGTFTSTSDYLSPVIDLERCSAITISNRIDNNAGVFNAAHTALVATAETTASTGTNLAKYVTKTIELNDTSDGIKVYLDINRPNGSFVDLYYKTGNTAGTFNDESWVIATPTGNNGVVVFSDGTTYDETAYSITPTATFTIFAIKIVMRSTGTSLIPKMQDFRAIALKA